MINERKIKGPEDLKEISPDLFPLPVFSYAIGSPVASLIAAKEKGVYNHYMWLIDAETIATQDWIFKQSPVEKYMQGRHALKFVCMPGWKKLKRAMLKAFIVRDLDRPWYRRLYDIPAIIGQAINCEWLQIPGFDICSDKARHLAKVDPRYNLAHPSPTNINQWMKQTEGYEVWGRYRLD